MRRYTCAKRMRFLLQIVSSWRLSLTRDYSDVGMRESVEVYESLLSDLNNKNQAVFFRNDTDTRFSWMCRLCVTKHIRVPVGFPHRAESSKSLEELEGWSWSFETFVVGSKMIISYPSGFCTLVVLLGSRVSCTVLLPLHILSPLQPSLVLGVLLSELLEKHGRT